MIAVVWPARASKREVAQHRLFGARVRELDVAQFDVSRAVQFGDRIDGEHHRRRRGEHLADAVRRDGGARDHDRHEGRHHDRHEDLDEVAQERGQRTDLHRPPVDREGAEPEHGDARDVHDQHDDREDEGEEAPRTHRGLGDVGVRLLESLGLERLAHEGAHDADPRQLLAEHAVDRVDPDLHAPEQRDHAAHDGADDDEHDRNRDEHDPGEVDVLPQRHDDAADREHGGGDEHGAGHQHQRLHLLHVVGCARDERGGAEAGDLALGELAHPHEDRFADIATERHRRLRAEVDGRDRGGDLGEREGEHDAAGHEDVVRIALRDAVVDDVRVEAGQRQRRERLDELEDDHADDERQVRPKEAAEEREQHA